MQHYTTLRIHEVVEQFGKQKTRADKIKHLQRNESHALKSVLRGTFDDSVVWLLPDGDPPYKEQLPDTESVSLLKQHTKFMYLVKGVKAAQELPAFKRERIFLDLLETVHPEDALVLLKMKNKQPPIKGLTKKIVQEAFPGLIVK